MPDEGFHHAPRRAEKSSREEQLMGYFRTRSIALARATGGVSETPPDTAEGGREFPHPFPKGYRVIQQPGISVPRSRR